jgi:hypothetical protein
MSLGPRRKPGLIATVEQHPAQNSTGLTMNPNTQIMEGVHLPVGIRMLEFV